MTAALESSRVRPSAEERRDRIERHYRLATWWAARQTFGRPALFDDAFDAAIDALIRAAESYDPGHSATFRTYASACMRTAIRYRFADIGRRPRATDSATSLDSVDEEGFVDPAPDPMAEIEGRDSADAILRRHPARTREALRLIAYEGMSQGEAAGAMGCSISEIARRLGNARVTLQGRSVRHIGDHAMPGRPACSPRGRVFRVLFHRHDEPLPGLPDGESWCPDCLRIHRVALRHGEMTLARQAHQPRY